MSVLTLIKRWTNKAPQILLSPHDKIADTKMILDNQHGEYMMFNDLLILLKSGALLEMTAELKEVIDDGVAHKKLMHDLELLGYDSFETVMKVLTEHSVCSMNPCLTKEQAESTLGQASKVN